VLADPQYGTCFLSPFRRLERWGGCEIYEKLVHPWFWTAAGHNTNSEAHSVSLKEGWHTNDIHHLCLTLISYVISEFRDRSLPVYIYRDIILTDNSHNHFTRTASRSCRQPSVRRVSNLTWVEFHTFKSNVLQQILSFYPPGSKEAAGNASLGSQTHVTSNKHVDHCVSEFCVLSEPTGSD